MREVTLNTPRVINGAVRYPVEGPIPVSDDEYERLAEAKAIDEGDDDDGDLSSKTVVELKELAEEEGVDLGGDTKKADIIAAITAHRAALAE